MKRFNQWLADRPLMNGLFIALWLFPFDMYYIFRKDPNRLGMSCILFAEVFLFTWAVQTWLKRKPKGR